MLCLLLLGTASCKPKDIQIEISPADSEVSLDDVRVPGNEIAQGLLTLKTSVEKDHKLSVSKPGYERLTATLRWNHYDPPTLQEEQVRFRYNFRGDQPSYEFCCSCCMPLPAWLWDGTLGYPLTNRTGAWTATLTSAGRTWTEKPNHDPWKICLMQEALTDPPLPKSR